MCKHTTGPQSNWAMLNWMEARRMWDADLDPVKRRRQFIASDYGRSAADAIERVYDWMETGLRASSIVPRTDSHYGPNLLNCSFLEPIIAGCRPDIDTASVDFYDDMSKAF